MNNMAARTAAEPAALHAWADLLTRQLAALETGDVEAFLELGAASDDAAAQARTEELDAAALRTCAELLDEVQERLRALRDAARDDLRELDERTPALRQYAQVKPAHLLDVRL